MEVKQLFLSSEMKIDPDTLSIDSTPTRLLDTTLRTSSLRAFDSEEFLANILPLPRATQFLKCNHCQFIHNKPLVYLEHITTRHSKAMKAEDLRESGNLPHGSITMLSLVLLTRIEDEIRSASCRNDAMNMSELMPKNNSANGKPTTLCLVCRKWIGTSSFSKHTQLHKAEPRFLCHLCCYRSHQKTGLKLHIIRKHSESKLKGNRFLNEEKSLLKPYNPNRNGNRDGPFRCQRCEIGYKNRGRLAVHMQMYHNGAEIKTGEVVIPTEPRTFFSIDFLREIRHHRKSNVPTVVRDIPKECPECGKKLCSLKNLGQHINLMHPEVKPYSCIACNRKFKFNRDLQIHLKSHGKSEPSQEFRNDDLSKVPEPQLIIGL